MSRLILFQFVFKNTNCRDKCNVMMFIFLSVHCAVLTGIGHDSDPEPHRWRNGRSTLRYAVKPETYLWRLQWKPCEQEEWGSSDLLSCDCTTEEEFWNHFLDILVIIPVVGSRVQTWCVLVWSKQVRVSLSSQLSPSPRKKTNCTYLSRNDFSQAAR